MEQIQNTLNIVHENFMVLYDAFVAFVGFNAEYYDKWNYRLLISSSRYILSYRTALFATMFLIETF